MREIRPETVLCPISRRWRAWEIPESKFLGANTWERIPGGNTWECGLPAIEALRYELWLVCRPEKLDTVGSMHPEQQGGEP